MEDGTSSETGNRDIKNHILFEIATAVANRVGGIYSVIKSKAPVSTAEYGDRYTLIGPWNRGSASVEVEPLTPTIPELATTIANMKDRGIDLLYGRWLIEGAPRDWRHVGVTDDDLKQVVEVMGEAARQLTQGFHLLRLAQGILGIAAAADVEL